MLHKSNLYVQPTKAGVLKKSSSLAGFVGVTKLIRVNGIHLVTLYCTA